MSRLHLGEEIRVQVPIRYGRRSSSRGCTFTMTFAPDGELGQAILVPCRKEIDAIRDLTAEAQALWGAEIKSANASGAIARNWGCVGLLYRAQGQGQSFIDEWAGEFSKSVQKPIPPVDWRGILDIPWPGIADKNGDVNLDLILATSTEGELNPPTAIEVADAWIQHGHEEYFFKNVKHDIRTSDDLEIWKRIELSNPSWLSERDYVDEIKKLR